MITTNLNTSRLGLGQVTSLKAEQYSTASSGHIVHSASVNQASVQSHSGESKPQPLSQLKGVFQPIKNFGSAAAKGDPKTIAAILVTLTAVKYIAAQKTTTGAIIATSQVAAISAIVGPKGFAIAGLITGIWATKKAAGLVSDVVPRAIGAGIQLTHTAPRVALKCTVVGASAGGAYLGRRIQIKGEGRVKAALKSMKLSENQRKVAQAATLTVPVAVGAAATYGALRGVASLSPQQAATATGIVSLAELGRRGYNAYMQSDSEAVQAAYAERGEAIQNGETTPIWEMASGLAYDTLGTSIDMASGGLLQNKLGSAAASVIRTVSHTFAEREELKSCGEEPSRTSGIVSSATSSLIMNALTA